MKKLQIVVGIIAVATLLFVGGYAITVHAATILFPTGGGTGWGNLEAGTVLLGNGTNKIATTTRASLTGTGITVGGGTNAVLGSGTTLTCDTASGSVFGCLSSADWTTFNNKQAALLFAYPLVNTANTVSTAFGTTTSNTWAGVQTFTNAPIFSSLTGVLKGNGSSALTVAVDGTDFTLIDANTCSAGQFFNTVTAAGVFSCGTPSGGATGLGTTSPWSGSGLAYRVSESAVSTVATTTVTGNNGLTGSFTTVNSGGASNSIGLATINAGVLGSAVNGAVPTSQATSTLYGVGTNGFVLAEVNGIPTWVATTTLATISGTLAINKGGTATTTFYDTGITYYDSSLGTISQASRANSNFNLVWDRTTPGLGIGTTSPWALLSVNGNGLGAGVPQFAVGSSTATNFIIDQAGRVGVSTTSPSANFTFGVTGNGYFSTGLTLGTPLTVPNGGTGATSITGLVLGNGASAMSAYAGTSCTNQFVRSLSAAGAATCATVSASDVSLANLSATDSTLTFSGTYNGSTARTIGLNLGNANNWTSVTTGFASSTQWATLAIGTTTSVFPIGQLFAVSSSTNAAIFNINGLGQIGVASSSPWALFSINAYAGATNRIFAIGSSTLTSLVVDLYGRVGFGTTTPATLYGVSFATSTYFASNISYGLASSTAQAASYTVDWSTGVNRRYIVNQTTTFIINATSSKPVSGGRYTLKICQDPTGGRAVTFATPGQLRWNIGTTSINTTANVCTIVYFLWDSVEQHYNGVGSSTVTSL